MMSVFGFVRANLLKVMLVAAAALLAACLLALVGMEKSAEAAFPGHNGKIAFEGEPYNQDIYAIDADGTNQTNITNTPTVWEEYPVWSPDGSKMAFTSRPSGGFQEIFVMDADGSNVTRLTYNSSTDLKPAWSADGSRIAFQSYQEGNSESNSEVFVMDADGSNQTNITDNSVTDKKPAWSADGSQLAFQRSLPRADGGQNLEIYTMNADGSDQTNITNTTLWSEYNPAWSPDGTRIAFDGNRDANNAIYVMDADGSNVTRLTYNTWRAGSPDWGSLTVDGTAPKLSLPAEITEVAADASGATVTYTPTANDDVDGSVPVECSPNSGSLFAIGATTVNCSASDAAGNQATGSFQVKVVYAFGSGSGGSFGEPVRDTELNRLAAGAGVPIKFGLGADYGLNIFAAGYPTSKQIACPAGLPPDNVEDTSTLSKSGLTYDAASGLYTYVWKTERAWKGTCRELNLKLADGSNHPVKFQFT